MYTFKDLRKRVKQLEDLQNSLMSIINDEIKEYGEAKPDSYARFNSTLTALYYAIDIIDKGLDGNL